MKNERLKIVKIILYNYNKLKLIRNLFNEIIIDFIFYFK